MPRRTSALLDRRRSLDRPHDQASGFGTRDTLTTVARLGFPSADSALSSPSRLIPAYRAIWLKFRERAIHPGAWARTVGSSSQGVPTRPGRVPVTDSLLDTVSGRRPGHLTSGGDVRGPAGCRVCCTLGVMRRWVLVSAGLAPLALIGGWSLAAARQPPTYDPVRDTISALAAHGATDRWIMTAGLAVLGVCHLVTAGGLAEAGRGGRVLLAAGGVATAAVAALPQPTAAHVPAAAVGFVALALWPAASRVPGRRAAVVATGVLLALLGWLAVELVHGELLGLSERLLAGAEAFWPLIVALTLRARDRSARSPH